MIGIIDRALQKSHNDPDLLYAKSCAYYLAMQNKDGKEVREQVLRVNPDHFDAKLKGEHFHTWDVIFQLPGWTEDKKELPEVMMEFQKLQALQLVRDHLRPAIAIVFPPFYYQKIHQ